MVSIKPGTSVRGGDVTSSPMMLLISIATATTNGTGSTLFNAWYNLDQRLSQKSRRTGSPSPWLIPPLMIVAVIPPFDLRSCHCPFSLPLN
ncbi:hypothetical protein ACA910_002197 [Epithemia clementina (nom. ined.)]